MANKMTKEEKNWRAQDDARILIEAESIKSDSPRNTLALGQAKVIAEDAKKRAKAAEKVSNKKKAPSKRKTTTKKKSTRKTKR